MSCQGTVTSNLPAGMVTLTSLIPSITPDPPQDKQNSCTKYAIHIYTEQPTSRVLIVKFVEDLNNAARSFTSNAC